MKRDQLRELGIEDEQVDQIMTLHGETVNALKQERDTAASERDQYKQQVTDKDATIAERDQQLKDISGQAGDNEALQQQIKDLQDQNTQTEQQYQQKLEQQAFDHKLEQRLQQANVHDVKSTLIHLDTERMKQDGDAILGLEDQVKELQEAKPFLFKPEEEPTLAGRTPRAPKGDATQPKGLTKEDFQQMGYRERANLYQEQPDVFRQLSDQSNS